MKTKRRIPLFLMATAILSVVSLARAESPEGRTLLQHTIILNDQSAFRPVIPVDLGAIAPGTPYLIKVIIVNESDRDYDFSEVEKTCNCSDPHFAAGPLKIGESRELTIAFESNKNRAVKGQGRFSLNLREADKRRVIPLSLDFRYHVSAYVGFNEPYHPASVAKDAVSLVAKIPITVSPQIDLEDLEFEIEFPTAQCKITRVSPGSWDAELAVEVALEALTERSAFAIRCRHPETNQQSAINVIFHQDGGIRIAPGILLFRQGDQQFEATAMLIHSGSKSHAEGAQKASVEKSASPPHVEITVLGVTADVNVQTSSDSSAKLRITFSERAMKELEKKLSETEEKLTASCRVLWQNASLETELPVLLP